MHRFTETRDYRPEARQAGSQSPGCWHTRRNNCPHLPAPYHHHQVNMLTQTFAAGKCTWTYLKGLRTYLKCSVIKILEAYCMCILNEQDYRIKRRKSRFNSVRFVSRVSHERRTLPQVHTAQWDSPTQRVLQVKSLTQILAPRGNKIDRSQCCLVCTLHVPIRYAHRKCENCTFLRQIASIVGNTLLPCSITSAHF